MKTTQAIVGLLLAAGAGARFGGGKLLHPLEDGVAIAAHAARNLRAAGVEVIAVVRRGDFPLADILEQEGCQVTQCAESARGMGHSLAHGIAESRDAHGWIVALGDMPRVRPATIRAIADALGAGAAIAVPCYAGEGGHPRGFGQALRDPLLALAGDSGARAVVERHREAVRFIDVDDPGVLFDIDARSDLERLIPNAG